MRVYGEMQKQTKYILDNWKHCRDFYVVEVHILDNWKHCRDLYVVEVPIVQYLQNEMAILWLSHHNDNLAE